MRELLKIPAIILLFISLSLLLSFTSSVDLSKTGLSGFIGIGIPKSQKQDIPQKTIPFNYVEANMDNLHEESDPPMIPLFFVEGLDKYTYHLRLYTATRYSKGVWYEDEGDYNDRMSISGGRITRYSVTPLVPFSGYLAVAKDTFFVTASAKFDADTGTYLVKNVSKRYDAFSSAHEVSAENALRDDIEMDVSKMGRIRRLTQDITKNAKNDYEKAVLIEKYLMENYRYDTVPWTSDEPVYTFLFEEKKGICKHFATAFVVMCRSIDLPARGVFGYLAKPTARNQTIFASQAHMWAEVRFEEGWIEFDPTPPPSDRIPTTTEITYIDEAVKKGDNFTVEGFVRAEDRVNRGYVEIYLKENKDEEGELVDILPVRNGFFSSNVSVPDISGEYHVIAHFVGSLRYESSWSDPIIKIYNSPGMEVNIPEMAAKKVKIDGGIYDFNGSPIKNADVFLTAGDKTYRVNTGDSGIFEFNVEFEEEGIYDVVVSYPGDNYTLPVKVEKQIEVGEITLNMHNTTLIREEVWNTTGEIYFNDRPLNSLIIFEDLAAVMSIDGKFNINSKIPENFPLGNVTIAYTVSELKYSSSVKVSVRAKTSIDVTLKKDKNWIVLVSLTDGKGNPVSGEVIVANHTLFAENGVAKMEVSELPEKFTAEFRGNEKYLPSTTLIDRSGFPFWILALLIPAGAYVAYRMKKEKYITFEWGDLPPIWDVGEEVHITVKNRGKGILRAYLDGGGVGVGDILDLKFIFNEPGKHILKVDRLIKEKIKESYDMEIKIMNYSDAVIETFGELVKIAEKKKGVILKDATAREVIRKIEATNSSELLHLFEAAKYGNAVLTRNDFSKAYQAFTGIVEEIA
jgi:transglutaminase-like putative cysteine protease